MLTTLTATREPWEAHMLCGRLRAEGVPATIAHENHIGLRWDLSTALGGVKVQVPEDWKERAWAIENACQTGAYHEGLAAEFGDIDDLLCPRCGSKHPRQRRPFVRAALAIVISSVMGRVLPPIGWIYCCRACGMEFRRSLCRGRTARLAWVSLCTCILLCIAFAILWLIFTTPMGLIAVVAGLIVVARWASERYAEQHGETGDAG